MEYYSTSDPAVVRQFRDKKKTSIKTMKLLARNKGSMVGSALVGTEATLHILTAAPGKDVAGLISAFRATANLACCVISASGVLSAATLVIRESNSGVVRYEGDLEIISLSSLYMPYDQSGTQGELGGLTISFIKNHYNDNKAIGGKVAGPLVAKTPIQVLLIFVLSIFLYGFVADSSDQNSMLQDLWE